MATAAPSRARGQNEAMAVAPRPLRSQSIRIRPWRSAFLTVDRIALRLLLAQRFGERAAERLHRRPNARPAPKARPRAVPCRRVVRQNDVKPETPQLVAHVDRGLHNVGETPRLRPDRDRTRSGPDAEGPLQWRPTRAVRSPTSAPWRSTRRHRRSRGYGWPSASPVRIADGMRVAVLLEEVLARRCPPGSAQSASGRRASPGSA